MPAYSVPSYGHRSYAPKTAFSENGDEVFPDHYSDKHRAQLKRQFLLKAQGGAMDPQLDFDTMVAINIMSALFDMKFMCKTLDKWKTSCYNSTSS